MVSGVDIALLEGASVESPVEDRFARWRGWLAAEVHAQRSRLFLWAPVGLMTGIAVYFALPVEPAAAVFWIAGLSAALLTGFGSHGRNTVLCLALAFILAGFTAAKLRTEYVRTAALAAPTGQVYLGGWVHAAEMSGSRRAKVIVDVDRISRIRRSAWPRRVQLTLFRMAELPLPGDYVQTRVRLYPLITPLAPGAFDYGKVLWFRGVGATGRGVMAGENERSSRPAERDSFARHLTSVRNAISQRIARVLPGDLGAIAQALVTGNRNHIRPDLRDRLSIAGLAHILAISGMHMSLVAGGLFWIVRAGLAAIPGLALAWPIKKIAAISALAAGGGYLLISGGAISTQRAFIMLTVMFVAVLFDRRAISLRNLAIAACVIMLLSPEAVLSAGFQMSFLAVLGLIAVHDMARQRRADRPSKPKAVTPLRRALRWPVVMLGGIATATLIAGIFTGLPAAFHFNRFTPYGLLANLLALPVVSLLVMPMATLATLLMPLGLEAWPLRIMGEGVDLVAGIAEWVAGLPNADVAVRSMPQLSAQLLGFALIWFCLWKGPGRAVAIVPVLLAAMLGQFDRRPDILIERSGKTVALRTSDGELALPTARRGKYVAAKWLLQDGDSAALSVAANRTGWRCSGAVCTSVAPGNRKVVYARDGTRIPADCWRADILITEFPLRSACSQISVKIDRFDLWRHGAHAVYLDEASPRIVTARDMQGDRPWVRQPVARHSIRLDASARQYRRNSPTSRP